MCETDWDNTEAYIHFPLDPLAYAEQWVATSEFLNKISFYTSLVCVNYTLSYT